MVALWNVNAYLDLRETTSAQAQQTTSPLSPSYIHDDPNQLNISLNTKLMYILMYRREYIQTDVRVCAPGIHTALARLGWSHACKACMVLQWHHVRVHAMPKHVMSHLITDGCRSALILTIGAVGTR